MKVRLSIFALEAIIDNIFPDEMEKLNDELENALKRYWSTETKLNIEWHSMSLVRGKDTVRLQLGFTDLPFPKHRIIEACGVLGALVAEPLKGTLYDQMPKVELVNILQISDLDLTS